MTTTLALSPACAHRVGRVAWRPNRKCQVRCEGITVAEVRAEMTANVWKVLVAAGDAVSDGDTLVILESMKMEIPVVAEEAGTVSEVKVAEGDTINEDDVIAVIS